MSSYFQETSSSIAPSVASSAFNWQAIHNHQLQQQQMNLQPNADIFHTHYQNLYHNQGYHPYQQKYNNSNYVTPSSSASHENISFPPSTSSSLPFSLNNHDIPLNHAQQYLNSSTTSTSNDIHSPRRSNGNNIPPDDSITTSPTVATNNNVTNNSLEVTSPKRNYNTTTSLELSANSLTSLAYNKSTTSTASSVPTTSNNTTLSTPSGLIGKSDSTNIQAAQTAAAAAAAVAAYSNPNTAVSTLDNNASDSYTSRMNLGGFSYGGVQGMTGAGTATGGLGDPNAAAMAAVHAAAASQGCYDMYAAATMASKNSSFYPWMKNYPGKVLHTNIIYGRILLGKILI